MWNTKWDCPYCFMGHIGRQHKPEEHLDMTLNLSELPLEIIQSLKKFFVVRQRFEEASRLRMIEKIILKTKELIDETGSK